LSINDENNWTISIESMCDHEYRQNDPMHLKIMNEKQLIARKNYYYFLSFPSMPDAIE